jgi:hypothetical protein
MRLRDCRFSERDTALQNTKQTAGRSWRPGTIAYESAVRQAATFRLASIATIGEAYLPSLPQA